MSYGLILYSTILPLKKKAFEKFVGKEENAGYHFKRQIPFLHLNFTAKFNTFDLTSLEFNLCGKDLTLYHTITTLNEHEGREVLKILWEKGKMLATSVFSIPHYVFYSDQNQILQFYPHLKCRLQMF